MGFEGFSGHGLLTLNLDPDVIINGRIAAYGCNNLYIIGNQATLNHTHESENAVYIRYSRFVSVETLKIYGRGNANQSPASLRAIHFTENSGGKVAECTLSNFVGELAYSICANYCSQVYVVNNIGSNNTFSYVATRGSYIGGYGTMPKSTNKTAALHGGTIVGTFTEKSDEENTNTTKPEVTKTASFIPTSYKFYRTVVNKWQTGIYIADFGLSTGGSGTSTGNNTGCFIFNMSNLRNTLNGKTIVNAKLTITRASSGGYDSKIAPHLAISTTQGSGSAPTLTKTYDSLGDFSKGQTRTVTIPTQVIKDIISNTGINSIVLYRPDKKQYGIFDNNCILEVTYK